MRKSASSKPFVKTPREKTLRRIWLDANHPDLAAFKHAVEFKNPVEFKKLVELAKHRLSCDSTGFETWMDQAKAEFPNMHCGQHSAIEPAYLICDHFIRALQGNRLPPTSAVILASDSVGMILCHDCLSIFPCQPLPLSIIISCQQFVNQILFGDRENRSQPHKIELLQKASVKYLILTRDTESGLIVPIMEDGTIADLSQIETMESAQPASGVTVKVGDENENNKT